jgi:hypothetical protein
MKLYTNVGQLVVPGVLLMDLSSISRVIVIALDLIKTVLICYI